MYRSTVSIPPNRCAFHENNLITHFCKYHECLLPLCKLCLPIHRRQHGNKKSPIELQNVQEELWSVQNKIGSEIKRLQQVYFEIINKSNQSNKLHSQMKKVIVSERQQVLHSISLYYDSLCLQIDNNYHRKEAWLQDITQHYNNVRVQMITILQKLQAEKHLRTIIMWNRLHPEQIINNIMKQAKRELAPPSMIPCDVQQLITAMSKNQKMTILDLHGDMGFNNLEQSLYTLRYGEEESVLSSKQAGISLITRQSKLSNRILTSSKSTDKI